MLVDKNKTMKETQHKALAEMLGFFFKNILQNTCLVL